MSDLENKNTTSTPLETVVAPVTPDASDAAKQAVERETISTQNVQDDLQELIASSTQPAVSAEKIDFSVNDDKKAKEDQKKLVIAEKQIPKKTLAMAAYSIIVALLAGFFYIIYAFFNYTLTGKIFPASFEKYMPAIQVRYLAILDTFQIFESNKYQPSVIVTKNFKDQKIVEGILADKDLEYVGKKKLLKEGVATLLQTAEASNKSLEELKAEVGQQWFFPKEVQTIAPGVFFDNSLQKAIVSIESVRFATAMKFFSILDSFVAQLSSVTSTNKEQLATDIETFISRGEKDINNYITSCYLNGYEMSSSCNAIGDFSNYYSILGVTGFNQPLFLQTMSALEAKLENTDFPSLDISMQSIDPLKNTINLNVEINTFKDDEAQLTEEKGVLNPHIFIVTSIINHLRESRFVLTDTININTLKVNKKKIKVGGQVVTVNSSSFTFALPLQNDVQREIYDFSDTQSQK